MQKSHPFLQKYKTLKVMLASGDGWDRGLDVVRHADYHIHCCKKGYSEDGVRKNVQYVADHGISNVLICFLDFANNHQVHLLSNALENRVTEMNTDDGRFYLPESVVFHMLQSKGVAKNSLFNWYRRELFTSMALEAHGTLTREKVRTLTDWALAHMPGGDFDTYMKRIQYSRRQSKRNWNEKDEKDMLDIARKVFLIYKGRKRKCPTLGWHMVDANTCQKEDFRTVKKGNDPT